MSESSLDLFCNPDEDELTAFAYAFADRIEALASELEVTVDYYLEEFHDVGQVNEIE
tara:strand:- start:9085 stop:9255 length:171 start_codon:yes stop_codon:yes gene_type:complete